MLTCFEYFDDLKYWIFPCTVAIYSATSLFNHDVTSAKTFSRNNLTVIIILFFSLYHCCCSSVIKARVSQLKCLIVVFQAQRDVIFELRRIAFDGENDPTGTEKRKAMYTKDYKMLGFTVSPPAALIKPLNVFVTHPSSVLNAEPRESGHGLHPNSSWDAGRGQHVVPGQGSSGHVHQG